MNDDSMKNLESELGRFRPAGLSDALRERLKREPEEERLTMGDRVLLMFSGMGALAACVVVGFTVWQMMQPVPRAAGPEEIAVRQQMAAEYQRLVAMR